MILEEIALFRELNIYSITLRIILAVVLGGILGIEREQKQHPAGFRTYVVVCLGSTLACITNIYMCNTLGGGDPARIPAQVISGIGFLGAGTILITRNSHIRGLTTAAGLWCCAAIGIALGCGFYCGAVMCSIVIIIFLHFLYPIDNYFTRFSKYIGFYAEFDDQKFIRNLIGCCNTNGLELHDLAIYPITGTTSSYATFSIKIHKPTDRNTTIALLKTLPGLIILEEL